MLGGRGKEWKKSLLARWQILWKNNSLPFMGETLVGHMATTVDTVWTLKTTRKISKISVLLSFSLFLSKLRVWIWRHRRMGEKEIDDSQMLVLEMLEIIGAFNVDVLLTMLSIFLTHSASVGLSFTHIVSEHETASPLVTDTRKTPSDLKQLSTFKSNKRERLLIDNPFSSKQRANKSLCQLVIHWLTFNYSSTK